MTRQRISRAPYLAVIAAATLVLAGCGREPYPSPSEDYAPPPPPPGELLGAPEPVPPPPPEPMPGPSAQSAPVIIAMAPIPNPPEPAPRRRADPQRSAPRAAPPAPRYVAPARPAPPRAAAPARPAPARPAAVAPAVKPAVKAAPTQTARITPPPSAARPAPVPALKPVPTPSTKAAPAEASNSTSPIGDRSTRLASLETTLADAIGRVANLATPDRFVASQPAEVTLTIPAEFAQTLRDEAAKNDLADAAASVNLTAILSGDGFAVTPDSVQSRPLVDGQPTEFQWTVTAQQGGNGPLHAELGADLLGAGSDTLSLGSVQSGGGFQLPKFGARTWGFAILALIAAVVIGLLSRGRGSPSRSAAGRREGRRARSNRPMTFSENEA